MMQIQTEMTRIHAAMTGGQASYPVAAGHTVDPMVSLSLFHLYKGGPSDGNASLESTTTAATSDGQHPAPELDDHQHAGPRLERSPSTGSR